MHSHTLTHSSTSSLSHSKSRYDDGVCCKTHPFLFHSLLSSCASIAAFEVVCLFIRAVLVAFLTQMMFENSIELINKNCTSHLCGLGIGGLRWRRRRRRRHQLRVSILIKFEIIITYNVDLNIESIIIIVSLLMIKCHQGDQKSLSRMERMNERCHQVCLCVCVERSSFGEFVQYHSYRKRLYWV